jgi:RNA polymerase sigma-70 factor (sigma-E family)
MVGKPSRTRSDAVADWSADDAVTRLFAVHYQSLVRLAHLLLGDASVAEEIAQDAYVGLHGRWRTLRDTDKALAYLRAAVVNRSRSALRHRRVVDRYVASIHEFNDAPSAETAVLGRMRRADMIAALRELPTRQREALVLRYYGELSESEIADAMGCSRGAVKSHTARGMAALRSGTEKWTSA